jgi:hypothetical protein
MKKQELNERGRAGQHFKNREWKKEHKGTWKKNRIHSGQQCGAKNRDTT